MAHSQLAIEDTTMNAHRKVEKEIDRLVLTLEAFAVKYPEEWLDWFDPIPADDARRVAEASEELEAAR
jgi:hypothetical protein